MKMKYAFLMLVVISMLFAGCSCQKEPEPVRVSTNNVTSEESVPSAEEMLEKINAPSNSNERMVQYSEEFISTYPEHIETDTVISRVLLEFMEDREYGAMIENADRYFEQMRDPEMRFTTICRLQRAYDGLGDTETWLQLVETNYNNAPNNDLKIRYGIVYGGAYFRYKKNDEGEKIYDEISVMNPNRLQQARIVYWRSIFHYKSGDYEQVLQDLSAHGLNLITTEMDDGKDLRDNGIWQIATILLKNDNEDNGIGEIEKQLQQYGYDTYNQRSILYNEIAFQLFEKENYDRSLILFKKALEAPEAEMSMFRSNEGKEWGVPLIGEDWRMNSHAFAEAGIEQINEIL